jgi:GNAT superfamily N-acetyltransferase
MQVRQLTSHPTDVAAWASLIAAAFHRPLAEARSLWPWLNHNQSQGPALIAWGAWDGDVLAAQYSCLPRRLHLPDAAEPVTVGLSTNMAVHPAYRGRGLIKQIAEPVYQALCECGALAGVGFSNADGVKVDQRSKSYGYQVVGQLQSHLVWLRRSKAEPLSMTYDWPNLPEQVNDFGANPHFVAFDASVLALHHRYAAHPFRRYRFGALCVGGTPAGLVIDRPIRLLGLRGASLLHVGAISMAALREVLTRWLAGLCADGFLFVRVLATPCAPGLVVLRQLGSAINLKPRHPHYLTVKPLQPHVPQALFDLSRWNCFGGEVL